MFDDGLLSHPNSETPPDEVVYNLEGTPLGFTWGEWEAVDATSMAVTVRSDDPTTYLFVKLDRLVPNGVYSFFYTTFGPDTRNPYCPGVERAVPVATLFPSSPPDPSSFVADEAGQARYVGQVDGAILDATQVSFQVIYHADGQTYHPLPNRREFETQGDLCRSSWSIDAMRQLHILQKWAF